MSFTAEEIREMREQAKDLRSNGRYRESAAAFEKICDFRNAALSLRELLQSGKGQDGDVKRAAHFYLMVDDDEVAAKMWGFYSDGPKGDEQAINIMASHYCTEGYSKTDAKKMAESWWGHNRLSRPGLSQKLFGACSLISLIGLLIFFSPNPTGNAILNLTNSTSNLLCAGFFVFGAVCLFLFMRKRR